MFAVSDAETERKQSLGVVRCRPANESFFFFFFGYQTENLHFLQIPPHPLPFCCGLRSDPSLRIKTETRPQLKWEELRVLSQTGTRCVSTLETTSYARTHTTSEQKKLLMEKTFDYTTTQTNKQTHIHTQFIHTVNAIPQQYTSVCD